MESVTAMDESLFLSEKGDQYLALGLDGQDYGIAIEKVVEIMAWMKATPIPNSPSYMKGVINLRGTIIPIIDLRLLFNLDEAEKTLFTVIVVVNIGKRLTGIIVDSVKDVIAVSKESVCETPELEGHENRQYIDSLAQVEGDLLILLNVQKLLNPDIVDQVLESVPG